VAAGGHVDRALRGTPIDRDDVERVVRVDERDRALLDGGRDDLAEARDDERVLEQDGGESEDARAGRDRFHQAIGERDARARVDPPDLPALLLKARELSVERMKLALRRHDSRALAQETGEEAENELVDAAAEGDVVVFVEAHADVDAAADGFDL